MDVSNKGHRNPCWCDRGRYIIGVYSVECEHDAPNQSRALFLDLRKLFAEHDEVHLLFARRRMDSFRRRTGIAR